MPDLRVTVRQKNGHYHIAYVNETSGKGITSEAKGHVHQIGQDFDVISHPNPQPGMPPIQTPQIKGWMVLPAGEDMHTHELTDYAGKQKEKDQSDEEIAKENIKLYKEAKDYEGEARKNAQESEDFVMGKQWDDEVKRDLNAKDRAALTINEIEPKIDLLSGYQRRNRMDIKLLPIEEGDSKVAQILNVAIKNILDQTNFEHEDSKVFEDEMITGRGNYNVYIDYESNIRGDIKVERFPWGDVFYGPHEKEDLSDCEYLIKTKWFSKAKLSQMYPDKVDELQKELNGYKLQAEDNQKLHYNPGEGYDDPDIKWQFSPDTDLIDIQRKEFRIIEVWRKEYIKAHVFANAKDDFYFNAEGWTDADIKAVKTLPGFSVIQRNIHKIRVVKTASKTLISDEKPDLAWDDFYMVPVYAKKRGKSWWGKVEAAKDPQREINKRHSQIIDIANKMTSYGWLIDGNTFNKPNEEEKFKRTSTSPGFVVEVADIGRPPQRVEGPKFPTELVNIMAIDSQKIKEIMNVNLEMSGQAKSTQSGVAIAQQKQQGLLGNEYLFDNHTLAKKKLARLILRLIQKVYTPERVYRVLQNQDFKSKVQIEGKPLEEYPKELILAMLKDADLTKYDIAIAESPWSPSNRLANFMMWSDMAKQGIAIPPQLLIELSDLPDKEKALQAIASQQQAAAQQEQAKMNMEVGKTQIAAQSKLQAAAMKQTRTPGA